MVITDRELLIIGHRIKEVREDNRLTKKQLGEILKVSEATISRYEAGLIGGIPIERIKDLADNFGLNPAWILNWSTKKHLNGVD